MRAPTAIIVNCSVYNIVHKQKKSIYKYPFFSINFSAIRNHKDSSVKYILYKKKRFVRQMFREYGQDILYTTYELNYYISLPGDGRAPWTDYQSSPRFQYCELRPKRTANEYNTYSI